MLYEVITLRDALLMGLSHSMPLTLLIALATLAYHANSIDKLNYYALILAALFQVLIVMVCIKLIIAYWRGENETHSLV